MKLARIDLTNFRQFYGRQALNLAYDDERNVTLIHAENGVGKTTLLNAVYWALFGDVTPRFEQKDNLLNFEAEREGGAASAAVEVLFEFDGREYRAQRRRTPGGARTANGADHFVVAAIERGAMRPLQAPDTFVASVIPREMARYFFFDGEHAETFSGERNTEAGTAIRSMLGCDLAEQGIKDLRSVAQQFTRMIGGVPGETEARRLQDELDRLEREQERDRLGLDDLRRNVSGFRAQKVTIEEQLRKTAGAREIQSLRDELERRKVEVERALRTDEAEVVRWVGARALAVVARRLAAETLDFIDEEALRGRIPSPYNEDFVRGLLDAGRCVCCRDLLPMTKEWEAVAALLRKAGNAEALNRIVRARSRINVLKEAAGDAPKLLAAARDRVARHLAERRSLEQRIGEKGKELEGFKLDEVREREAARAELERRILEAAREEGALQRAIEQRGRQVETLVAEVGRVASRNAKARSLFGKRQLALGAADLLGQRLAAYEAEARDEIEAAINRVLERTARRDYRFRFDAEFGMSLLYGDTGRAVPRSGGENQLMSLAFTAALVQFAKARVGVRDAVLSPGTVAPLVLDAPFGQLDTRYKAATASFIPDMSGQVVLLLSSSHATPEVLEALRPRVGMEYVLVSHNRGPRGAKGDDAIALGGRTYARSLFNQERAQTTIEPVT